jgi:hypothetical protein
MVSGAVSVSPPLGDIPCYFRLSAQVTLARLCDLTSSPCCPLRSAPTIAQVYLEASDYTRLAAAVLDIIRSMQL